MKYVGAAPTHNLPNETVGADIHVQLSQAKCVGAVPVCPPERPRSGVSIPKIHALCAGYLTTDAPLWGDTGGHTGTAPTNLHHIFPHIPHKQNNHLHVINPNAIKHPHAIHSNEAVGAAPACPPERPRSGVSIPRTCALCVEILTMDAPLWGDTGGHIGSAPTHLYQTPRGVPLTPSGLYFR